MGKSSAMELKNGMEENPNKRTKSMRDNMKKITSIFIFVIALFSLTFAAGTASVSSSSTAIGTIYISDQSLYSPYPVEPGKYMDLWLRVQYKGEKTIVEDVICAVEAKFPFSFDPGESSEKSVGTMAPYNEVVLKYKLHNRFCSILPHHSTLQT